MPIYEYVCAQCKKRFSESLSFAEHDSKKVKCPHCRSTKVRHVLASVGVKTSRKS